MDNHHFMLKISRLFPSSLTSCQFRTLPDVAESSISITKTKKILHENDQSSLSNKPSNPKNILRNSSSAIKLYKRNHCSDVRGRRCSSATPMSTLNPKKFEKIQETSAVGSVNHSSSSNSGWFTSSDEKTRPDNDVETDTFFSLSSNSGDSFHLKTSRRFRSCCEEMKSIDETGRCSFSSGASFDTVLSKCSRKTASETTAKGGKKSSGKTWPEHDLGSDHISTQLYYHNSGDSGTSFQRRKTSKNRRKIKKSSSRRSFSYSPMIGESYAVEKSSSDPHGDFRASMVEMIVEKQIFAAADLERLLFCFLSLNAVSYHGIIFDVFSEICQTLFSN